MEREVGIIDRLYQLYSLSMFRSVYKTDENATSNTQHTNILFDGSIKNLLMKYKTDQCQLSII